MFPLVPHIIFFGGIEKKTIHSLRAPGASAMFNAGVPEKLIRDVTGHTSNALHLYERPNLQQKKEVSRVLMQGKSSFDGKENQPVAMATTSVPTAQQIRGPTFPTLPTSQPLPSAFLGSLFSGVGNCNITISPQNFTVNVGSANHDSSLASTSSRSIGSVSDHLDLDSLMHGFDLDEFWST